ncbi:MAG: PAS domain-containing protein, partial [Desulfomonilaceae bacterium]
MIKTTHLGNDLFLLMFSLTQVKNRERIIQLFTEALSNIFHGVEFSYAEDGSASGLSVSIATSRRQFGIIEIRGQWNSISEDVMALIRNAVKMLGIILENRIQEEDLIREKDRLELVVESRTADLVHLNQHLQEQIKERLYAEKTLKEKTEELERYFTESLDLLCIADTDGYFRRLNPQWQETLGYDLAELEGRRFLDFVHPDDIEKTEGAISALKAQESVVGFENRYLCKDGSYRWIEWRSHPKGRAIYAVARDITRRKLTEQALRESEERFRILADRSFEGVVITSDNIILDANSTFCNTLGYGLDEIKGLDISHLITPDLLEATISPKRSGEEETYESIFLTKNGREIPVQLKTKLIPYRGINARLTSVRDISKTIKAREVQKRLATAIEQAMETVIITDSEGIIQYANPVSEKITGYTSEELIGKNPRVMKSGVHDPAFYKDLWDTIKSGDTWSGRLVNKRKDGSYFHEEATISPVRNSS